MIKDDLVVWSSTVESVYKEVSEFIENNKLPGMLSYKEVSSREGLYTAYAAIITINNKVAELLVSIHKLLLLKLQFQRRIRSEGYPPALINAYTRVVDEISDRINIIDKMLNTYKFGVESQLRFYQSVQYIMGSPRLNSYD